MNMKSKSIVFREFVWSKPAEENLPNQVTEGQFTFKAVKESEISNELKNRSGKRCLAWVIPPAIAQRRCSCFDYWPFAFIDNLSLETGVVLSEWKVAKVIPLYKSGSLAEIDNYRPISILPSL